MEPSVKERENTIRILNNLMYILDKGDFGYGMEAAARAVEAYAFLQAQVKAIQASIDALNAPKGG